MMRLRNVIVCACMLTTSLLVSPLGAGAHPSNAEPRAETGSAPAPVASVAATAPVTVQFVDTTRPTDHPDDRYDAPSRTLPTVVHLPPTRKPAPLAIFVHGFNGNPQEAVPMFDAWARAGYVVAIPVFALTNRAFQGPKFAGDFPEQTRDVSFVLTQLIAASATPGSPLEGRIDGEHVALVAASLGSVVAYGFYSTWGHDPRIDAIVQIGGFALPFPSPSVFDWEAGPPLLVVHSVHDNVVPYLFARLIYGAAQGRKALLTLYGATHVSSFHDPTTPHFPVVQDAIIEWFNVLLRGDVRAVRRLEAISTVPNVADIRHTRLIP